jgi:hypothetical protein
MAQLKSSLISFIWKRVFFPPFFYFCVIPLGASVLLPQAFCRNCLVLSTWLETLGVLSNTWNGQNRNILDEFQLCFPESSLLLRINIALSFIIVGGFVAWEALGGRTTHGLHHVFLQPLWPMLRFVHHWAQSGIWEVGRHLGELTWEVPSSQSLAPATVGGHSS